MNVQWIDREVHCTVHLSYCTIGIDKERDGKMVCIDKALVTLCICMIDPQHGYPRVLEQLPIIPDRAQLFCASGGIITWIEDQNDRLSSKDLREIHPVAALIAQPKNWGLVADGQVGHGNVDLGLREDLLTVVVVDEDSLCRTRFRGIE